MALHITDVLEYGGTPEDLVWKSDIVNFNNNSRVIVRASQEAVYLSGGVMSETMESGTHILKSGNLPGFRRIQGFFNGGKTVTTGEVYFFNLAVVRPIEWGTRETVEMMDPVYHVPIRVGAGGTMHIQVANSRKLLEKLVGMQESFTRKQMDEFFRGVMAGCVGNHLSNALSECGKSSLEFSKELRQLSEDLKDILSKEFEDYGLKLEKFFVDRVRVEDKDIQKVREILTNTGIDTLQNEQEMKNVLKRGEIERLKAENEAAVKKVRVDTNVYETVATGHAENALKAEEGQVQAQTNAALGITEKEKLAFGVMDNISANTGASTGSGEMFMSGGPFSQVGMGAVVHGNTGANAAAAVEGVKAILNNQGVTPQPAASTARQMPGAAASEDPEEKLAREYKRARDFLKQDFDDGVLTRDEYKEELAKLREKYASGN